MDDVRTRAGDVIPSEVPSRAPDGAEHGRKRVVIEAVTPSVDGGRFAAKRTTGEEVQVEADVFADGHDVLAGVVLVRGPGDQEAREVPLELVENDRWAARFTVDRIGRWTFRVAGWVDHLETWRQGTRKKVAAGQDVRVELEVGARYADEAAEAAGAAPVARQLADVAHRLRHVDPDGVAALLDDDAVAVLLRQAMPRHHVTTTDELPLVVDPPLARFSTWYELFPRSTSEEPGRHGTFADVVARLPYVADMGFDVLYLPPVHPIGRSFRKGPNNAPVAGPDDPGSPWAIGAEEGGHDAILPALGTEADFRDLVAKARELGLEVAMDIAFQCAPDHPWVREHPTWFRWRPDGTVQYAENPPKKYQDIYPIEFETPDWKELWDALLGVFLHWIDAGVRVFRVDNPHTKPFPFWEWVIGTIKADHPEVLFLAEAFTRPKVMHRLAKLGFSQSYTYFAWRNGRDELREYFTELSQSPSREYFRPNVWPNTPDILTEYLQHGGRPAFVNRVVLAATLSASYGIYGPAFELGEHVAREPGSEEYLDSEKYQIRHWDLDQPGSLRPVIARLNRIRRENPALQHDWSLRFHDTDNPALLCYSKSSADGRNVIMAVVNLDPHNPQSGFVHLDLSALGVGDGPFELEDLFAGGRYTWQGPTNYVALDPWGTSAHVLRVVRPSGAAVS